MSITLQKLDTLIDTIDSMASNPNNNQNFSLPKDGKMQAISVDNSDNTKAPILAISENNNIPTELKAGEVLIKVYASAVNRADLLQAKGRYPPPKGVTNILGLECSGIIVSRSNDCQRKEITQIGSRVMALVPGGSYAQYCKCHESTLISLSKNIEFAIGAATPEAFLTAYQLLFKYGGAIPMKDKNNDQNNNNELVLIHAGASGVGTTLLQYCKLFNLRAFVTCGSDKKINYCIKTFGAIDGWNYKTKKNSKGKLFEKFSDAVLDVEKNGANIILDCVGSNYWYDNMSCIALDGKWVIYGFLSGSKVPVDVIANVGNNDESKNNEGNIKATFDISTILRKRVSIIGTTLRTRNGEYKQELVNDFTKYIVPFLNSKEIGPIVDCHFEMKNADKAHEHVRQNKNIGKVVLNWDWK